MSIKQSHNIEARTVHMQARLILEKRVKGYQQKVYKQYHGQLFHQWKRHRQQLHVQQLHTELSKTVRPPSNK